MYTRAPPALAAALVGLLLPATASAELRLVTFGNVALAGTPITNATVAGFGTLSLPPNSSAVLTGQLTAQQWALFAVEAPTSYVRLWIDDHLMVDAPVTSGTAAAAAYAIPVPFLPGRDFSKLRAEVTTWDAPLPAGSLTLLANGTAVPDEQLSAVVEAAEVRYFAERAAAEMGWNTWLSDDMLTHALLPHGLAVTVALRDGGAASVSRLCADGPSCDPAKFPAKHGLHAVRGEYTEIESVNVSVGGTAGASFKVETAAVGPDPATAELRVLITTLSLGDNNGSGAAALAPNASITLGVPSAFLPLACNTSWSAGAGDVGGVLVADCPGLSSVRLSPASDGPAFSAPSDNAVELALAPQVGGTVSFVATVVPSSTMTTAEAPTQAEIAQSVAAARAALVASFLAAGGAQNETVAGMTAAISWNVIWTPYEGIFTPVFRGSPWSVSKPHNYVLFEWDTCVKARRGNDRLSSRNDGTRLSS
jgi:hypothetical protein